MVFGLVLTPNKKYSQTVEKDYTLTNAALDTKTSGAGDTQLMVTVEKNTFLLCTLNKQNPQCTLDLQVSEGETIGFCSTGTGTIHLVGYMLPDDPMGVDYEGGEESMSDEEDEETEVPQLVPIKGAKKQQKGKPAAQEEESDDDDDDDDDVEDDDDDSELGEEEEGDDDDDDDDDEEEDDSEDEKPQPQKKAKLDVKQNGLENGVPQQKSKKELKKQKKQEAQQQKKDKQDGQQKPQQQQQQKTGKKQVLQGGVTIEDLKVGDGPEAKSNKKVAVYYEGRLKSNNKVFDSCKSGNGFKFTIGRGEVIRGWEVGVAGMKVGSKRRIICPPQMAYGAKGSPPVIPPNSTLVFDVELRHIKN